MPRSASFRRRRLMRWARHLLSAEDLRKRAEHLQELRSEELEGSARRGSRRHAGGLARYRYSVRTDSGPIALRAFWSMHVEAMNWSGMGLAEYAAALGLSPHALRIWRDRLEELRRRNGLAIPASSECPGSIKQRC